MIHLVVITGDSEEDKAKAGNFFKKNPGWQIVAPDVWLLAARGGVAAWQDFLVKQVPNLQFLMVRATPSWGSGGIPQVAQWLKGSSGWF